MIRFYIGRIKRMPLGSAVQVVEPVLQGRLIEKIRNLQIGSEEALYVLDCDDEQHHRNLAMAGVKELTKEEAIVIAAEYHPKRKYRERGAWPSKAKIMEKPDLDLDRFIKRHT